MTESKMQLVDWLDDLCVRFIINLPREELESVERICFQVEEAQWFYEDFIRPLDPTLPSLNLRQFCLKIFQHCPLFVGYDDQVFSAAFSEFLAYKTRVPVRGAIMLNEAMDEAVLVKGWKKNASWSFPRGKINKDEKDIDCAIREVFEETGYDIKAAGLVRNEDEVKSIEITMREQHMKLFVFPGVPMDTHFEPRTRKEISKIEWYRLTDLPALKKTKHQHDQAQEHELSKNASKFYMVAPFMVPLKKYIAQLKKRDTKTKTVDAAPTPPIETKPIIQQQIPTSPPPNDMNRLMAQLRQSQRVSHEKNLPEVANTAAESMKTASMQLKSLLNPPSLQSIQTQIDSAARESKAQAMLNLLRNGAPKKEKSFELPPETPFDQITMAPKEPPPSPKRHPHQAARAPVTAAPAFPFPVATMQNESQGRPPLVSQPIIPGPLLRPAAAIERFNQSAVTSNGRPPTWRQEPGEAQSGVLLGGDRQATAAPAANKLPIPKLTAHSSKLLDLFKQGASMPQVPQLGRESVLSQSSAIELMSDTPAQPLLPRGIAGGSARPGHALASKNNNASLRPGFRAPSQQEQLLNLFKGSSSLGKSSPTLMAPVELAANLIPTPTQGQLRNANPTILQEPHSSGKDVSPLTEDEQPKKKSRHLESELLAEISATVTGPLNELQFESPRLSHEKTNPKPPQSPKHLSPKARSGAASKTIQQQIKILPRPGSSHTETQPPVVHQARSLRTKKPREVKEASSASPKPVFQPQILKRPTTTVDVSNNNPPATSNAPSTPQILTRPTNVQKDQLATHPPAPNDQKAQLLALFGSPSPVPSIPVMPASALPKLPVSERQDGGLVSPVKETTRSRMGSFQEIMNGNQPFSPTTQKPADTTELPSDLGLHGILPHRPSIDARGSVSAVPSPVDKSFLLGFLDGFAKEGAK